MIEPDGRELLEKIYAMVELDNLDECSNALDYLYDSVDRLIGDCEFDEIDDMFMLADTSRLGPHLSIGLLATTLCFDRELTPFRSDYSYRVVEVLLSSKITDNVLDAFALLRRLL